MNACPARTLGVLRSVVFLVSTPFFILGFMLAVYGKQVGASVIEAARVDRPRRVFDEIGRVLKPAGRAFISLGATPEEIRPGLITPRRRFRNLMHILAMVGSCRKRGNTARIVQMVEAQTQALAARHNVPLEFETLYLGDSDIRPCLGCRVCFDRGEDKCPLKDDIPSIRAKMDAAEGLILASPVYVNDVSGVAKNWIDRLAYLSHRPALAGKCAYLIATVAGGPTGHTLQTMSTALRTWGCKLVGQAGYKMGPLLPHAELESRYSQEPARVAERLFQAIVRQEYLRPSFFSLVMFKIQQLTWQREAPNSLDYAYWQGQGWLNPARTFYIAHRANPIKVTLARWVGALIFRLVT